MMLQRMDSRKSQSMNQMQASMQLAIGLGSKKNSVSIQIPLAPSDDVIGVPIHELGTVVRQDAESVEILSPSIGAGAAAAGGLKSHDGSFIESPLQQFASQINSPLPPDQLQVPTANGHHAKHLENSFGSTSHVASPAGMPDNHTNDRADSDTPPCPVIPARLVRWLLKSLMRRSMNRPRSTADLEPMNYSKQINLTASMCEVQVQSNYRIVTAVKCSLSQPSRSPVMNRQRPTDTDADHPFDRLASVTQTIFLSFNSVFSMLPLWSLCFHHNKKRSTFAIARIECMRHAAKFRRDRSKMHAVLLLACEAFSSQPIHL